MSGWLRVHKRRPCLICGCSSWCLVQPDGSAAICPRISDGAVKDLGEAGYLHKLTGDSHWKAPQVRRVKMQSKQPTDFGALVRRYQRNARPADIETFADTLGVFADSLQRLGIGSDGSCWTFPVQTAAGVVVGIRRRFPDGDKRFVTGSKAGLFIPSDIPAGAPIIVTEGESDCAAALTLGFNAVGRCGCRAGAALLSDYCRGRDVAIMGDADEPGRIGARVLAEVLRIACPSVRILFPPTRVKDIRQWLQRGGSRADVERAIRLADHVRLGVCAV